MPAPDPSGLYIEEYDDGGFRITCEVWWHGNRANRINRMLRVARNIKLDGWRCEHCGAPIPLYRRSDARFCRQRCRKAAARLRARSNAFGRNTRALCGVLE